MLSPQEQASFDEALREVMSQTARRVRRSGGPDWAQALRDGRLGGGPGRPESETATSAA
ncbi:hypothetical protein [Nostocoides jenkinsii]|uniref:Uncharacterized protein n=1 Tax=Nostocoides jenkinsii Ben 74 TaxID=1193518 RepID=A0A077M9V5_9MICO|nr:hypothetical protein [Tetrasphaera jenkinsii]CCI54146.1 hypothetical protein BN13_600005 [Tetrasphaera jenkinsii Ben 74]